MRTILLIFCILLIALTIKSYKHSKLWNSDIIDRIRLSVFTDTAENELTENLEKFSILLHSIKTETNTSNPTDFLQASLKVSALLQKHNLLFEFVEKRMSSRHDMLNQHFSKIIISRHNNFVASLTKYHKQLNQLVQNLSGSNNLLEWQKSLDALSELIIDSNQTMLDESYVDSAQHDLKRTPAFLEPGIQISHKSDEIESAQNVTGYLPPVTIPKIRERYIASLLAKKTPEERIFDIFSRHSGIRFKPVYGALLNHDFNTGDHGIETANAYDISNSLVNGLRQVKIPARYVYGTIKVSEENLITWFKGVDTLEDALSLLKQSGIPYQFLKNKAESPAIIMEHIWVEAWLEKSKQKSRWIALDASFDQHDHSIYQSWETTDSSTAHFSRARDLAEEYLGSVKYDSEVLHSIDKNLFLPFARELELAEHLQFDDFMEEYEQRISAPDYVDPMDYESYLDRLPESLPYEILTVAFREAALPDSFRRLFQIQITETINHSKHPVLDYTTYYDQLTSKSVKLVFKPATQDDRDVLDYYLGRNLNPGEVLSLDNLPESIPAYLIQLKPNLVIDGKVVATGKTVFLGETQYLHIFSQDRFGTINKTINGLIAGESVAIDLHAGHRSSYKKFIDVLNDNPYQMLINTAASISSYLNNFDLNSSDLAQPVMINYSGFSTVSTNLITNNWFGQIATVNFGGIRANADSIDTVSVFGQNKAHNQAIDSLTTVNSMMSGKVLEVMLTNRSQPGTGISATQVFNKALDQNIAIIFLDKQNQSSIDSLGLNNEIKNKLKREIEIGNNILIPVSNIQIGEWVGTGYKVSNPETGNSQFIVEQQNTQFKRQHTAYLDNNISRSLSAIELLQNRTVGIKFPETHITDQCGKNLLIKHMISEIDLAVMHFLTTSSAYKNADLTEFQPAIASVLLDHISLVDKNN